MFRGLPALRGALSTRLDGFRKDESGSLLIFSLFVFVAMLCVAGLAVDFMRVETQRVRLQSTLDRAVLAGASLEQTLDSETVVRDYFERAGLSEFLDSVDVIPGTYSKTVEAHASASVRPYFLQMLGLGDIQTNAAGIALEGFSDIEVSLVVDVSGSMGWTSSISGNVKLDDLKRAAKEFLYRIQCNPDSANLYVDPCTITANTVSVNLVPYQEQVLVGEDLLQHFNPTNEHTNASCVDFVDADYTSRSISLTDVTQRAGYFDGYSYWYDYQYGSYWPTSYRARDNYRSCKNYSQLEIQPMEESWTTLDGWVQALTAQGGTSIEMGMKWGTALIDPAFQPAVELMTLGSSPRIIDEFKTRPSNYGNPSVKKFIVLMTDGENTYHRQLKSGYYDGMSPIWYSNDRNGNGYTGDEVFSVYRDSTNTYRDPIRGYNSSSPYGAGATQLSYPDLWNSYNTDFYANGRYFASGGYWNDDGHTWLENPVEQFGSTTKNANLLNICAAARAENITIYTVGFETSVNSTAIMKQCASSDSHHFDVDGDSIDDAFAAIARNIQKLRLMN